MSVYQRDTDPQSIRFDAISRRTISIINRVAFKDRRDPRFPRFDVSPRKKIYYSDTLYPCYLDTKYQLTVSFEPSVIERNILVLVIFIHVPCNVSNILREDKIK